MKKVKKVLRIFILICLIILAGVGVGLIGGVPIPKNSRRKDKTEFNKELKEAENNKKTMKEF